MLEDTEGYQAVTLKKKEDMVCKAAFPHSGVDLVGPPPHRSAEVHHRIDRVTVQRALFDLYRRRHQEQIG